MIDLHAHILWGLDDGATDAQETLEMLQRAAQQGVKRIVATVHAYPGIQHFDLNAYAARLDEARDLCAEHGLGIELLPGAEIAATDYAASVLRNGNVPTLGNSDYALIELWHNVSWSQTYHIVDSVLKVGFIPILAHVERYSNFVWEPKKALQFRNETGALLQMNASTLLRRPSFLGKRFIKRMLAEQGIDVVASDAHNMRYRPPDLGLVYPLLAERVGEAYANQLTSFAVKEA